MKTPRNVLLSRHTTAQPKLDALRQSVVTELSHQATKPRSFPTIFVSWFLGCLKTGWQELFLSPRRIWTGMAAVWLLIFLINFSQRDNVSSVTGQPVHSGGAVMSVQAQQRWMNEIFADRALPPDADRPKNFSPKPRTQTSETATV